MKVKFIKTDNTPVFADDLSVHANYIIREIYLKEFPGRNSLKELGIARRDHGGIHVSRVAILINIFANLFKKYRDKEANELTPEVIKILQIAALLHDSAREDEGDDKWDRESSENCYNYLVNVLNLDKDPKYSVLIKDISESIANKSISKSNPYYSKMNIDSNGNITCEGQFSN